MINKLFKSDINSITNIRQKSNTLCKIDLQFFENQVLSIDRIKTNVL